MPLPLSRSKRGKSLHPLKSTRDGFNKTKRYQGRATQDSMRWDDLLSNRRLGKSGDRVQDARSQYQRDYDRIVFSSAFRRLQDKTQVVPLAESDYVRTRLTHSIEASCVGRSLGTLVGEFVLTKHIMNEISAGDFGSIVAATCLAHDIGNPPFGHSGEDAIQNWFRDN
jgi:dGTPase